MGRKPRKYWQDVSNIKLEVLDYIQKFGTDSLKYRDIRRNGYNNLVCAMQRSGFNLTDLCSEMGLPINYTPKNYYTDINNVIPEILELVDQYGDIPSSEYFYREGRYQLYQSLYKFHGGVENVRNICGVKKQILSSLEVSVKRLIDELVTDKEYIDNGRKNLLVVGLNTQNPRTKQWLQIDRYYFKAKVAIEINGKQHYQSTDSTFWDKDRTNSVKKLDKLKRKLLKEQGVTLIVIPFNRASKRYITKVLRGCGVLKLRELLETPSGQSAAKLSQG